MALRYLLFRRRPFTIETESGTGELTSRTARSHDAATRTIGWSFGSYKPLTVKAGTLVTFKWADAVHGVSVGKASKFICFRSPMTFLFSLSKPDTKTRMPLV